MCPVRSVTYVSGRSLRLKRAEPELCLGAIGATGNFGATVSMWKPSPASSAVNLRNSTYVFLHLRVAVGDAPVGVTDPETQQILWHSSYAQVRGYETPAEF
jgi:hypothetical protein